MQYLQNVRWHTVQYNLSVFSLATAILLVQPTIFGPDTWNRTYGIVVVVLALVGGVSFVLYLLPADDTVQVPWLEVWLVNVPLGASLLSFGHIPDTTAHTAVYMLTLCTVIVVIAWLCRHSLHASEPITCDGC